MRPVCRALVHVTGSLAALSLAACAGGSAVMPGSAPVVTQSLEQRQPLTQTLSGATTSAQLFVSAANNPISHANEVDVYDAASPNALLRTITKGISGPNGMAVDSAGNLFVANVDNATLEEFGPHSDSPIKVYRTSFHNPLTLAVGNNGTLYAVNYNSIGHGSSIFEFRGGSPTPAVQMHFPGGLEGLAVDDHGNLYAGYNTSSGRILRFTANSTIGRDLGITLGFTGGVAIDNRGNLVACDQTGHLIDVFAPGKTTPSKVITQGLADPYQITFSRDFTRLYVADSVFRTVNVYSYPNGQLVTQIQRSNAAFGVAVDPIGAP